jgi:hypothetical protein
MARGRLLFWLWADIARLDTEATATAGGYDDDFRETTLTDTDADGVGDTEGRVESADISIKAQLETDRQELQRMTGTGDVAQTQLGLVVHMKDMEALGYVEANGDLKIRKADRLVRIKNKAGVTRMDYARTPIYLTHAIRLNAWLGYDSNLALLTFGERARGRV